MKTEIKKLDATKREINIEVSGDIVKNKFEDIFKKIGQEVKVPGFRPGNVPRDILEKRFLADAHQEVLRELIPDVYNQAIEKETLDVIDLPAISEVKLDRETLSFKATVEVAPEIKIKNYKGLKVNYKKIEVTADDLKRNMDSLKETHKVDSLDDNFAKGLGYPNLSQLQEAIQRQLFIQKESQERQRIEADIIEGIIKELDFKLPQSLIARHLKEMVKQAKVDLALRGVPREEIDKQEASLEKELTPQAEKQVRVYLVLAEIAKKENIALDDHMTHKVMEFLLKQADWQE